MFDFLTPEVVTYIVIGEAVVILLLAIFIIAETISRNSKDKKAKKDAEANNIASTPELVEEAKEDNSELDAKIAKEAEYVALLEHEVELLKELEELKAKKEQEPVEELVAEQAPIEAQSEEADEEEIEDEEIEIGEEEAEDEESLESDFDESSVIAPEIEELDEEGKVKKIKRKFNTRMMFAPYETKEYYNEVKNYLTQYRAKGRYSSRCETFRYKGLLAKVALAGKSLKVYLALDPEFVAQSPKYHFKNVSDKKQYAEVPVMIKVKSDRGLKHFKELVDIMMADRGVTVKKNFEATNYIPQLIPNGEAILGALGYPAEYIQDIMNADLIPDDMSDDLINYLPVVSGEALEDKVEASVYLDTLCSHFDDGDEITLEKLIEMRIVSGGSVLKIKARGTLDKKLTIYADEFESDALKMLMCTNCTAIRVSRD